MTQSKPDENQKRMNFKQYKRLEHIRHLCDDHNIDGVFKYDGTGLSLQEAAQLLFEGGYITEPTIAAMIAELERSVEADVNNRPVPEPYSSEWEYNLVLADPKGFPISEQTVRKFQEVIMIWAVENGLDVRTKEGVSWLSEDNERG